MLELLELLGPHHLVYLKLFQAEPEGMAATVELAGLAVLVVPEETAVPEGRRGQTVVMEQRGGQ